MIRLLPVALLAASAGLSLAAPASTPEQLPQTAAQDDYCWDVTNWSAGCARAGCYFDFDIGGQSTDFYPAFTAHCSGDESLGYEFRDCETEGERQAQVQARFLQREGNGSAGPRKFMVALRFDGDEVGSYFIATGYAKTIYNQFVAPLANFSMAPSEIIGVA